MNSTEVEKWMTGKMSDEQFTAANLEILGRRLESHELWVRVPFEDQHSVKVSIQLNPGNNIDLSYIKEQIARGIKETPNKSDINTMAANIYSLLFLRYTDNKITIKFTDSENTELIYSFDKGK